MPQTPRNESPRRAARLRRRLRLLARVGLAAALAASTVARSSTPVAAESAHEPHAVGAASAQKLGAFMARADAVRLSRQTLSQARQTLSLRLATPRYGDYLIALTPHDLRAPEYCAEATDDSGTRELGRAAVTTYRGRIRRRSPASLLDETSEVRLTITDDQIEGAILGRDERLLIEPAKNFDPAADSETFLVYRAADVTGSAFPTLACGVGAFAAAYADETRSRQTLNGAPEKTLSATSSAVFVRAADATPQSLPTSGADYVAKIATEADYEYVAAVGGGVAAAANNQILAILNVVDGVYAREIGLTFQVVYQHAYETANEPYHAQAASDILTEFANYWEANYANTPRDLAHLFTGRAGPNGDNIAGLAYVETACHVSPFSYALSRYTPNAPANFKYDCTAHEIGHNLGATHPNEVQPATIGRYGTASCVNTIMGVNDAQGAPTFCGYSRLEILNYLRTGSPCGSQFINVIINESDGTKRQPVNGVLMTLMDTNRKTLQTAQSSWRGHLLFADVRPGLYMESLAANPPEVLKLLPFVEAYDDNYKGSSFGGFTIQGLVSRVVGTTLDAPDFFVRQHYFDFLNRAPDPDGAQFWTNQITSCQGDPACVDLKRQNVSAAFFLSPEFQQTGYFVHRLYKAAFGRNPRYAEFVPDARAVGAGVVGGAAGWQGQLDQNKQTFLAAFVARPSFTAQYPTTLSAAQYVDALIANTGVAPSAFARDQLVAGLASGAETRASVLRQIAENPTFAQREFNAAFVEMEYFGYLRRNPDGPPDPDPSGYQFWLNKLNAFGGDYIRSEMVRSFILSDEYQLRFLTK